MSQLVAHSVLFCFFAFLAFVFVSVVIQHSCSLISIEFVVQIIIIFL